MMKVLVVHGPNLNLLGEREPAIYGKLTLDEINEEISKFAVTQYVHLRFFQSNHEGELIDWIQSQRQWAHGIVINPAAFTHYSIALRDAISSVGLPAVEVHLSDIKKREKFRRISVIQDVCIGQISGKGWKSYIEGIKLLLKSQKKKKQ